jgi:bacteriochlorophyll/chlorophyll synthetase
MSNLTTPAPATMTEQSRQRSTLRGHLDLFDPVTWTVGPQGFICGMLAGGAFAWSWQSVILLVLGCVLSGPLAIGFSQSINDFFDRDLDAVNEPTRPIPAGLVTLRGATLNFTVVALLAIGVALLMPLLGGQNGGLILLLTLGGLALGIFYSVPPIAFKRNGLFGPLSVGLGYNFMTWLLGCLVFGAFKWEVFFLALVSAFISAGLLIMNDVKSYEGDKKLNIRTLPVQLGLHQALLVAFFFIDLAQIFFFGMLVITGHYWLAGFQVIALLVQFQAQVAFYNTPTYSQYKKYLLAGNGFILLLSIFAALSYGNYPPFNSW